MSACHIREGKKRELPKDKLNGVYHFGNSVHEEEYCYTNGGTGEVEEVVTSKSALTISNYMDCGAIT